jgi:hypothetical protein
MLTSTPLRPVCSPPGKQRNVNPAKATPAAGLRAHQGMERAPCTGTLASARRTRLGRAVWAAAAGVTAGPRSLGFVRPHPEMHAATSDAPAQMNSTAPHSRREMYLGHGLRRARAADSAAPGRWLYRPLCILTGAGGKSRLLSCNAPLCFHLTRRTASLRIMLHDEQLRRRGMHPRSSQPARR